MCNREVAVDFSMGKTVFLKVQDEKEAKKSTEEPGVANTEIDLDTMDVEGEEEGEESDEGEEEGEEGEGMEVDEDGNVIEGEDDGEGEEEGGEEGEEAEEEEEEEEDNTDDVEKGCTVFVRYVLRERTINVKQFLHPRK